MIKDLTFLIATRKGKRVKNKNTRKFGKHVY